MHVVQTFDSSPRFLAAVPLALGTTLALLFIMARMIYTDVIVLDKDPYPELPPIVMEPPTVDPAPTPRPVRLEASDPPPPAPRPEWVKPRGGDSVPVQLPPISEGPGDTLGAMDGLPFARVMVPPAYPATAARRGIEGYVDLQFDVSASGVTTNIRVLGARPEGVFDKAAVEAVSRWRFQPKTVNGQPQAFQGLSKRLRFTLEKS